MSVLASKPALMPLAVPVPGPISELISMLLVSGSMPML